MPHYLGGSLAITDILETFTDLGKPTASTILLTWQGVDSSSGDPLHIANKLQKAVQKIVIYVRNGHAPNKLPAKSVDCS